MKILIIIGMVVGLSGCLTIGSKSLLPEVQIRQCFQMGGSPEFFKNENTVEFKCVVINYIMPIQGQVKEKVEKWTA